MGSNANAAECHDVQAVFDMVIDAGYYGVPSYGTRHYVCSYMCIALERARNNDLITWEECALAKTAISNYLTDCFSKLSTALAFNHHPYGYTACLAVYRDWANRPPLTRVF